MTKPAIRLASCVLQLPDFAAAGLGAYGPDSQPQRLPLAASPDAMIGQPVCALHEPNPRCTSSAFANNSALPAQTSCLIAPDNISKQLPAITPIETMPEDVTIWSRDPALVAARKLLLRKVYVGIAAAFVAACAFAVWLSGPKGIAGVVILFALASIVGLAALGSHWYDLKFRITLDDGMLVIPRRHETDARTSLAELAEVRVSEVRIDQNHQIGGTGLSRWVTSLELTHRDGSAAQYVVCDGRLRTTESERSNLVAAIQSRINS